MAVDKDPFVRAICISPKYNSEINIISDIRVDMNILSKTLQEYKFINNIYSVFKIDRVNIICY